MARKSLKSWKVLGLKIPVWECVIMRVGGVVEVGRDRVWLEGSIGASDGDLLLEMAMVGARGRRGSIRGDSSV